MHEFLFMHPADGGCRYYVFGLSVSLCVRACIYTLADAFFHQLAINVGPNLQNILRFFTARCYASVVLAMGLCLSVCHKSEFY